MDSENFIVSRHRIIERLEERRMKDLSSYPFRMADDYGVKLPPWVRWALSFGARGGILSRLLEVGLPLAIPFLMKKQTPFLGRLMQRFFSPKS